MNHEINRLLNFALQKQLIEEQDKCYCANLLLDVFHLHEFHEEKIEEKLLYADDILLVMLDYAASHGLIENTSTQRDLIDTRIMNCIMPRPSEIHRKFKEYYQIDKKSATDYFYLLCISSNYIRKSRIDRNMVWKTNSKYGELTITINLSKPEKDPKEIAMTTQHMSYSYPNCLLCKENEGYCGHQNHPARQTLRLLPLNLHNRIWYLQYSPYGYFNEHCILLNSAHTPMKITEETFSNLFDFLDIIPHYFIGSNADLPIVGGSILTHDHYQGGRCTMPMETAEVKESIHIKGYDAVACERLYWPLSVIRLRSSQKNCLIKLASSILQTWIDYHDASVNIVPYTNGEPHNTITPIARKKDGCYELDLVLRNNRTSEQYPSGIFHPHQEVHHIKKENIGLIEVMGLAVLPPRLKQEFQILCKYLRQEQISEEERESIQKHLPWIMQIEKNYDSSVSPMEFLKKETGYIFEQALEHCGIFSFDEVGTKAFHSFINSIAERNSEYEDR